MQESRRQDQETRREQQEEAKKKAHESRHREQQTEDKKVKEEKSDERRKKDLEKHLMKAEKLRKKLKKSELKAAKLAADALAFTAEFRPVTSVIDDQIVKTSVDVQNIEGVLSSEIFHANVGDHEVGVEVQAGSKPEAIGTADDLIPAKNRCKGTGTSLDEGTPHPMADITATIVVAPELEAVKLEDGTEADDAPRSDNPAVTTDATDFELPLEMEDLFKAGDTPDPERLPEVESDSSNDVSENSDSSISSSSNLKSASDSDSSAASSGAPEETSSRSNGPVRVPPPKRESTKRGICHKFLANGYCPFGHKCRHRHELPERGTRREKLEKVKEKERDQPGEKRMSLYQRLVEQEQAEENKLVLMAVKKLGEDGFFEGGLR